MLARLLYRDGLMLVVDKPAGYAVHRGPKGGEALEDYFDALRFGLPRAPALAHRLDRDTTGCLVLGRHRKALSLLGKLFKQGKVGKTYWAVVEGGPDADEGRIEIALSKRDESRGWWMKADPHGLPSATTWKVMGRAVLSGATPQRSLPPCGGGTGRGVDASAEFAATPLPNPPPSQVGLARLAHENSQRGQTRVAHENSQPGQARVAWGREQAAASSQRKIAWLALEPLTGRTHQLRVHCAEMGFPIVGDTIYGKSPRNDGPPLHLHARDVTVPISKNKPPVTVTAPVPEHIREMLSACGWKGD